MIWLGAQEAQHYHTDFRVLEGAGAIANAETRIAAIARQPDDDDLAPSGAFRPLTNRPQPD